MVWIETCYLYNNDAQLYGVNLMKIARHHPKVAVFLNFERVIWVFDATPDGVQRTDTRVPCPRENKFTRLAGGDHLVVNDVGSKPTKGEFSLLLPDDLMTRGKAN